jgi:hypothetical protein
MMPPPLKKPANARVDMPEITGFVDAMREAFGLDEINSAIKRGSADGTFWALESGFVVGSPPASAVDEHLNHSLGEAA